MFRIRQLSPLIPLNSPWSHHKNLQGAPIGGHPFIKKPGKGRNSASQWQKVQLFHLMMVHDDCIFFQLIVYSAFRRGFRNVKYLFSHCGCDWHSPEWYSGLAISAGQGSPPLLAGVFFAFICTALWYTGNTQLFKKLFFSDRLVSGLTRWHLWKKRTMSPRPKKIRYCEGEFCGKAFKITGSTVARTQTDRSLPR